MPTLYCADPNKKSCYWSGEVEDLVELNDDCRFTHCPNCHGEDFDVEEDEDNKLAG